MTNIKEGNQKNREKPVESQKNREKPVESQLVGVNSLINIFVRNNIKNKL